MDDLKGTLEQYYSLTQKLKDKAYNDDLERYYIKGNIKELKEEIAEQINKGYERQERVKVILRSIGFDTCNKAIFRMNTEKPIKSWDALKKFEAHMLRIYNTPNANPELIKYDIVLKGVRSPCKALQDYYDRYNLKQYGKGLYASRIATELIYTVSPKFFMKPGTNNYDFELIEKWVTATMQYLEAQFPDNQLVWAMLHMSESTPHIHVLVCGREYHEKWKKIIPSHSKFFGSKEKLRNLQTNYANALQRNGFLVQRGLRGSKATHKEVSRWRAEQHEKDKLLKDNKELLRKKDIETRKIIQKVKEEADIEKKARNKVLRDICKQYNLNPNAIGAAIEKAKNSIKSETQNLEKKIDN